MASNNKPIELTSPEFKLKPYKYSAIIIAATILILTVIFKPINIPYWEFSTDKILALMIALLLISLFLERTIEVIIKVFMGKRKQELVSIINLEKQKARLKQGVGDAPATDIQIEATQEMKMHINNTKRLALLIGFILGISISALGIRTLQQIINQDVFITAGNLQRSLFVGMDTLITGALLGGGSNGIHKILDAFLTRVDWYRNKHKPVNPDE
ncbi:MAG: hypothetical protein J7K40_11040 [candidate division Zixibacteria bacterium]|nr:hypothetical protein [candidate division Zixibacteria bacterium]